MASRAAATSSVTNTFTVGAISKSSNPLPLPGAREALLQQRPELGHVLGREQRRDPAVGDLGRQRRVLRPDGGQEHRDPLLHGRDRQLQRLARAVRQRQLQRLALDTRRARRDSAIRTTVDVLARALELAAEALPVPALGHLRPGRADAEDHPPAGELIQRRRRHRRHRRRAAGHLEDRRAEPDLRGRLREPAEDGRRVGPVGLRGPHRVVAEPLGLLDEAELVLGRQAEAPVSDVHAELHAARDAIRGQRRCDPPAAAGAAARTASSGRGPRPRPARPARPAAPRRRSASRSSRRPWRGPSAAAGTPRSRSARGMSTSRNTISGRASTATATASAPSAASCSR